MPRVLADGHVKLTVLTTSPANPAQPTAAELNAAGALDLSCKVLSDNFQFGPTDSDKVAEKALCDTGNANAIGAGNYQAGWTLWRYYLTAGGADPTADAAFLAFKTKGVTFWGYLRRTDKLATDIWASADEIAFGAELVNDTPQTPDGGGWIKYRIPCEVQRGYPFTSVAAAA